MKRLLWLVVAVPLLGGPQARSAESEKSEAAKRSENIKEAEKRDPFAPSTLMRDRARKASSRAAGGDATTAQLSSEGGPLLEGLIIKDKTVLACFRVGKSSVLVEPGESFQSGEVKYTFAKYGSETVTLQDQDGNTCEIKPGSREKPCSADVQGGRQP